jgi:hypothetical protein
VSDFNVEDVISKPLNKRMITKKVYTVLTIASLQQLVHDLQIKLTTKSVEYRHMKSNAKKWYRRALRLDKELNGRHGRK